MTTALYAQGKYSILRGVVDLLVDDIRVIPVTATYTPDFSAGGAALQDVDAGARAAVAVPLATAVLTITGGLVTFDADDVTFPGVATGDPIVGLLMYLHTGDESTSYLLGYFDYFANLPITPDTRDVIFTWPNTTNRIFSW